jgi:PAS domain S-box-containing protein
VDPAELTVASDVLQALPVAVVVVDEELVVRVWNGAAEVLYGHVTAEVLGRPVLDVLFEREDRPAAARVLLEALDNATWEGDSRVRRADGMSLVSSFRAAPVPAGAAWIATDGMDLGLAEQERAVLLSAERAARDTAQEALGLVEAIFGSAPVGIAVFGLDLRYNRVNDAFAELTGVPADAHVGHRVGDLFPFPPQVGADLRRVVTTGRAVAGRSVELIAEDTGVSSHCTVRAFPIHGPTGDVVGAGLTAVDVTEINQAVAERAALLRRAESAQERLAILATASTVLTTTMELDELLERLARVLAPAAADWCVIELVGPGGVCDHVSVSHRDRQRAKELAGFLRGSAIEAHASGVVADVLRTGQSRLVGPDTTTEALRGAAADRGAASLADAFQIRSSVVVPIEARGQTLGVLILSTDGDRVLDDDDLDLAVEVAHRASLAVANARAYQNEHRIAETLQRALLPATVPDIPELDIAVRYVAATDGASVGGDWYDVIAFDSSPVVGLAVGDVMGHDIGASTSMGQVRTALRASVYEHASDPAAAVARLDRLVTALGLPYSTCVLASYDPTSGLLRWSNAGHPPPLLVRDGRASYLDEGSGLMLGISEGEGVAESAIELHAEDLLVLYTDGLVERRGESLQAGLDRLAATVSALVVETAQDLCESVLAQLLPPSEKRGDDVAVLVVRVRGTDDRTKAHRLEIDDTVDSAATARGFTAGVLEQAGCREIIDTAVLLVSELVTNALRHARPPYALVLDLTSEYLECRVEDSEDAVPSPAASGELAESGRGLLLLEALATEWGTRDRGSAGKTTWFRLAL